MKPILEINNISKKFLIGHQQLPYLSFRDKLTGLFKSDTTQEEFWALRDVSLKVMPGESIGIIGRNGAGKSTLLKILSRITPPSAGNISVRGRIASLLEVGTGFHPELTGRENIFMNGSILGMKHAEIKSRFDAMVDFSGTEKFLDTPLKHYSSGMQLRLAFAVAAHLDPEILIIDEVLAVGDAAFQKKCLGKMEDVSKSGRTILFVSHHMGMIQQLCSRCLWLDGGRMRGEGDTMSIVQAYLQEDLQVAQSVSKRHLGKGVYIKNLTLQSNPVRSFDDLVISFEVECEQAVTIDSIGFYVNSLLQERVGILDLRNGRYSMEAGRSLRFQVTVKKNPLIEGEYRLGMFLGSAILSGNFDDLISLRVEAPRRDADKIPYPLDVRGKLEFDYEFYAAEN